MEMYDLLIHPDIKTVISNFRETKIEKQKLAYNLFSLSSYTGHLENFHSDVIASLLNPKGLHEESNKFLLLFIDFLNVYYHTDLDPNDFKEAEVLREKGRIDIWIRSEKANKAILIENKMNNAGDREDQLDDYHDYSATKASYPVSAIIYLSLDGFKKAPVASDCVQNLIKNIGAFTNKKADLISGWLEPSLHSCSHQDSSTLIYQYIKLIRYLARKQMDNNIMKDFYNFVNENNAFSSINEIIELKNRLPEYRTNQFVEAITNIEPFVNPFRWKHNYMIFDNYREGLNSFKLDIHFMESGSASILIWNPPHNNVVGLKELTVKLQSIYMLEEFELYDQYKYAKFYRLSEQYKSLADVDNALISFTKVLLDKLKKSKGV